MSTTKQYWQSVQQLENDPEFVAAAGKEFAEELPVEDFLNKTDLDATSTNRRDFLKFLGFSVGAATLAACETPVIKSIPYVVKPHEVIPGVPNYYATTFADGLDYASILVKTREGRPIHIEGNKQSAVTAGGVNSRINSSVLSLYDGNRLKEPMIGGQAADWAAVDAAVKEKLQAVAAKGGKVRILTNSIMSPSTKASVGELAKLLSGTATPTAMAEGEEATTEDEETMAAPAAGSASVKHVTYDAVSYAGMIEANVQNFGQAVIPSYHFDKAKVIVSLGADFLANWLLSVQYANQYGKTRKPDGAWMSRHFQFETNLSLTGSNADFRGAIKPSEMGAVAARLYNMVTGSSLPTGKLDDTNGVEEKLAKAASDLKGNKGNCLVVSGSNDPNVQVLVNAINSHLNNYGSTLNLDTPTNLRQGRDQEVKNLIGEMNSGQVDAVIVYGTNPAYSMPASWGFAAALAKVGTKISMSSYLDETSSICDIIAPDHHYLESWNDAEPIKGHYSLSQPVISKLYNTRQAQDSFLAWAGSSKDYYSFLQECWEMNMYPQAPQDGFQSFWNQTVHDGVFTGTAVEKTAVSFGGNVPQAATNATSITGGEWEVQLYVKAGMGEGAQATNPWLHELPDPVSRVTWDNYITMNPADMAEKGFNIKIAEQTPAHMGTVTVGDTKLELPVYPIPGQRRGTVGIAVGYGRTHVGKIGEIGKNAFPLISESNGTLSMSAFSASVGSGDGTYAMASLQTHSTMMGRKIINETDYETFKKKPATVEGAQGPFVGWNQKITIKDAYGQDKTTKELNLWDDHGIELGHRWGMSIDLNTCIGCGSCVTACASENNVPVVGKDEIRRTRSMMWIRIDRYFTSDATKEEGGYVAMEEPSTYPDVAFQPVMCQHCNHAPCETVCPVAATTHSEEGLNQMTYNRCVGTRYCANNCPYKVRRFNWFNYMGYQKFKNINPSQDEMGRMVLNPDVVVRSRGVMEKCSLCVQRIQGGKLEAKKAGKKIADGAIQTACSSACPTNAIAFGDVNDETTTIAKQSADPRAYHLLEEVGVQPNIWYQTKVRNRTMKEAMPQKAAPEMETSTEG